QILAYLWSDQLMSDNPLKKHFRRAVLWVKLPSGTRWYDRHEISVNENGEIPIYGLTAIDEILLNTPDAMFNGHALQSVIKSCAPDVTDVKKLVQPDIETIFLGIKAATNRGKFEINRPCPACQHENSFDVICSNLMD
ncbi:MAG: hypothetical protein EBX50_08980, partial [Chitinophagia bacterium]|nr:hypothetical protein [Chitinophagia bacterium]